MRTILTVLALSGAAIPALADAPYTSCLRPGDITQFQPVAGNNALIVIDAFRKKYRLNFQSTCYGLDFHTGISVRRLGGGASCLGKGDQVLLHDAAGPPRCFISSIDHYTPEMEAADKAAKSLPIATRP